MTTADCCSVDILHWHRDGALRAGSKTSWTWEVAGEAWGSVGVAAFADRVELAYPLDRRVPIREAVPVVWTPCTFGGTRPWFRCPARGCARTVRLLYLAGRWFLCRQCSGLVYRSQRQNALSRAQTRARALREQLGGECSMTAPLPARPPRMREATYRRRIAAIRAAEAVARQAFEARGMRKSAAVPA